MVAFVNALLHDFVAALFITPSLNTIQHLIFLAAKEPKRFLFAARRFAARDIGYYRRRAMASAAIDFADGWLMPRHDFRYWVIKIFERASS